jgi:hypothetical protein
LYNYEKNRREGYMRKAEEALDGSLSMLMTTDEDGLWQMMKLRVEKTIKVCQ